MVGPMIPDFPTKADVLAAEAWLDGYVLAPGPTIAGTAGVFVDLKYDLAYKNIRVMDIFEGSVRAWFEPNGYVPSHAAIINMVCDLLKVPQLNDYNRPQVNVVTVLMGQPIYRSVPSVIAGPLTLLAYRARHHHHQNLLP